MLARIQAGKAQIIWIPARKPWQVERCIYETRNGEVAWGYTNHTYNSTFNDVYILLLERDDKNTALEDWLRSLTSIGIKPVIVAETARGYHCVTTNIYNRKEDITTVLEILQAMRYIDEGIYVLARIRSTSATNFTNILRIGGKYETKDIVVRRWLPPPTLWHTQVLALYARECALQVSATRIAHGCPGFTGKPSPAAKAGLEIHRKIESELTKQGWKTEVELRHKINNMLFTAIADAIKIKNDHIEVLEIKSTKRTARTQAAQTQAHVEAALSAISFMKNATAKVITPDFEVHHEVSVRPQEAERTLLHLLKSMFHTPNCELCIFNTFCKGLSLIHI